MRKKFTLRHPLLKGTVQQDGSQCNRAEYSRMARKVKCDECLPEVEVLHLLEHLLVLDLVVTDNFTALLQPQLLTQPPLFQPTLLYRGELPIGRLFLSLVSHWLGGFVRKEKICQVGILIISKTYRMFCRTY